MRYARGHALEVSCVCVSLEKIFCFEKVMISLIKKHINVDAMNPLPGECVSPSEVPHILRDRRVRYLFGYSSGTSIIRQNVFQRLKI